MVPGITPDKEFIKDPNVPGPTKEEIRCLILCKAGIRGDEVAADIGCGVGGITLELAKRASRVYSIDRDKRAIEVTKRNLIRHGLGENVKLIKDDATQALKGIDSLDIAIIGGSGGKLSEIIELIAEKLRGNGKIIVTAVLLETKIEAIKKFRELGFDVGVIDVNIARGRIIERGTMMIANNPISLIWSTRR